MSKHGKRIQNLRNRVHIVKRIFFRITCQLTKSKSQDGTQSKNITLEEIESRPFIGISQSLNKEKPDTPETSEEYTEEPDELSKLISESYSNDDDMKIWTSTLPWVSTNFQNILGSMGEGAIEYRPVGRVFITASDIKKVNQEPLCQELARRGLQVEVTILQGHIRRCNSLSNIPQPQSPIADVPSSSFLEAVSQNPLVCRPASKRNKSG
ncbi:hypothetical protein EDC01DRAFT_47693 [Geopyxis carbonaria]|nr:hypothetical protein EDC01DRAFT_47693 [Geopyxis carbonaria]